MVVEFHGPHRGVDANRFHREDCRRRHQGRRAENQMPDARHHDRTKRTRVGGRDPRVAADDTKLGAARATRQLLPRRGERRGALRAGDPRVHLPEKVILERVRSALNFIENKTRVHALGTRPRPVISCYGRFTSAGIRLFASGCQDPSHSHSLRPHCKRFRSCPGTGGYVMQIGAIGTLRGIVDTAIKRSAAPCSRRTHRIRNSKKARPLRRAGTRAAHLKPARTPLIVHGVVDRKSVLGSPSYATSGMPRLPATGSGQVICAVSSGSYWLNPPPLPLHAVSPI